MRLRYQYTMPENLIDEFDLHALIDNQLDYEDAKRVRRVIAENPELLHKYRTLTAQKKLLLEWWMSENKPEEKQKTRQDAADLLFVL